MVRGPPRSTRTHTLVPNTPRFEPSGRAIARQHLGLGRRAVPVDAVGKAQGGSLALERRAQRAAADMGEPPRSEEHTSELQSLMRISYAVFCLKKKTKYTHKKYTKTTNHLRHYYYDIHLEKTKTKTDINKT